MILQWFIAAAAVLEILRIFLLSRDMRKLAIEKGEDPLSWSIYTVILWVGVELAVLYVWYLNFGYNLSIVAGVILGIIIARVLFYFLKRNLENRGEDQLEEMIEEIGSTERKT